MGKAAFANPVVDRRLSLFRHLSDLWSRVISRDDETSAREYSLSAFTLAVSLYRVVGYTNLLHFKGNKFYANRKLLGQGQKKSGDERI